jgi:hypothetical protein
MKTENKNKEQENEPRRPNFSIPAQLHLPFAPAHLLVARPKHPLPRSLVRLEPDADEQGPLASKLPAAPALSNGHVGPNSPVPQPHVLHQVMCL